MWTRFYNKRKLDVQMYLVLFLNDLNRSQLLLGQYKWTILENCRTYKILTSIYSAFFHKDAHPLTKIHTMFYLQISFDIVFSCLSSFNTMILVPLCATGKVILTVTKFRGGLRIARTCNQTNTNNIFPNYLTVKGCKSFHILQERHSLPTGQQILL